MKIACLLIATAAAASTRLHASAFVMPAGTHAVSHLDALPTVDAVTSDDFMKQLGHASQLIPLLHPQGDDDDAVASEAESTALQEVLSVQLNHSDGIRGFFAVYLTSPESLMEEEVPAALAEAVKSSDMKVMVPLACMNVIMPTAMTSVHKDAELKESAGKTASSGKKILRLLKGNDDVTSNCKAIFSVCNGAEDGSGDLIEYWKKFFANYQYEDEQKSDIALAVSEFC